jgi:hypothetical protein
MKKFLVLVLAVMVSFAAAQKKVKSKVGSVDITKQKGGGGVVCSADFNDEMTLLKLDGDQALVKGMCGQGWVEMGKVEYVAKAAGDKSMQLDGVEVVGWLDNPAAVFVLDNDAAEFEGINMDRDFREYLKHTVDRENIERQNAEN